MGRISQDYESVVETIQYNDWWSFVKSTRDSNGHSVFRGHSNFQRDKGHEIVAYWNLKSSLHRDNPCSSFELNSFEMNKMSELLDSYSEGNKTIPKELRPNSSFLEKVQFLQHYGVSTPLIDFTTNPLTALYFAASGIYSPGVRESSSELKTRNISIIEIDHQVLEEHYGIKSISGSNHSETELTKLTIPDSSNQGFFILNPSSLGNGNLIKQNGTFIYWDDSRSIEDFCFDYVRAFGNKPKAIKYHLIPYSSIDNESSKYPKVLFYLALKKQVGLFLFDDIQGLKHDLNAPNVFSSISCCAKNDCDCRIALREIGLDV